MAKEEKQLLLKDICARLPYGVKILYTGWDNDRGFEYQIVEKLIGVDDHFIYTLWGREKDKHSIKFADFKPYLRPMSSMTEEEENEWRDLCVDPLFDNACNKHSQEEQLFLYAKAQFSPLDWLNAHHFDYRGLIKKGLALEAPEGIYKTE